MNQPPIPPQNGPNSNWQGHPQQGGYPQQGFQNQTPPKKKGGCMKFGLIALGVLIVLVIIIAATSGGDDDSTTVSSGSGSSEDSGGESAPGDATGDGVQFMGKTDRDTGANAGDTITKKGIALTTTPLDLSPSNGYSEAQVCTTVTIQNNGDSQESFNTFDWSMQDPNGTSRSSSFMSAGNTPSLSSGEIAPGGQTSGAVCFDGDPSALPGEYVVLYTGNIFTSDRLGWVNQF